MKRLFSFFSHRPRLTLLLTIGWTILIFIGCSLPGKDLPKIGLFDNFDKVVHVTFFLIFFVGWSLSFPISIKRSVLLILVSIAYGFGIEYYQLYFVAGRSFDVWDGVSDSLGALLGLGLIRKNAN